MLSGMSCEYVLPFAEAQNKQNCMFVIVGRSTVTQVVRGKAHTKTKTIRGPVQANEDMSRIQFFAILQSSINEHSAALVYLRTTSGQGEAPAL